MFIQQFEFRGHKTSVFEESGLKIPNAYYDIEKIHEKINYFLEYEICQSFIIESPLNSFLRPGITRESLGYAIYGKFKVEKIVYDFQNGNLGRIKLVLPLCSGAVSMLLKDNPSSILDFLKKIVSLDQIEINDDDNNEHSSRVFYIDWSIDY